MGLAGPRKRTKLSHDPNNTAWSRSTESFGHKILATQGWKPGDFLGAKDAAHASHYSKANASHIRVLLKDDNLGLGAKRGSQNAETFGLSAFSGLLGRLNGKSDEVLQKEQSRQRDVELRLYQDRKWGNVRFVSAGFLVGDKIEDIGKEPLQPATARDTSGKETSPAAEEKRSDKAGAAEQLEAGQEDSQPVVRKDRKRKKGGNTAGEDASAMARKAGDGDTVAHGGELSEDGPDDSEVASRSERRERKVERRERREKMRSDGTDASEEEDESSASQRKAEKRARKEQRRERREQKALSRAVVAATSETMTPTTDGTESSSEEIILTEVVRAPANLGRHAVRQRYIAQKRLASLDPKALKEIFMIKTTA